MDYETFKTFDFGCHPFELDWENLPEEIDVFNITDEQHEEIIAKPGNYGGRVIGINGCKTEPPAKISNIVKFIYHYSNDCYEGDCFAVAELSDGRFFAWSTFFGVTGNGFSYDAYGGDADIFYANDLKDAVMFGLTEDNRRKLNITFKYF